MDNVPGAEDFFPGVPTGTVQEEGVGHGGGHFRLFDENVKVQVDSILDNLGPRNDPSYINNCWGGGFITLRSRDKEVSSKVWGPDKWPEKW